MLIYYYEIELKGFNFCRVVVQGAGPGPRYGHVMSLVGQRFLLSISGNDGALATLRTAVRCKYS